MDKKKRFLIQFIAGILFCLSSAVLFFFEAEDIPTPIKITLLIIGIALIATSKRRFK